MVEAFYTISQECDRSCMHGDVSSIRQPKHPNIMKV